MFYVLDGPANRMVQSWLVAGGMIVGLAISPCKVDVTLTEKK